MTWAVAVAGAYTLLFLVLDPNWAWVAALVLFVPYRRTLLRAGPQQRNPAERTDCDPAG